MKWRGLLSGSAIFGKSTFPCGPLGKNCGRHGKDWLAGPQISGHSGVQVDACLSTDSVEDLIVYTFVGILFEKKCF